MLYIDQEAPEYGVWRFMIDEHHQRKGYGTAAMREVIAHVGVEGGEFTYGFE